MKLRTGHTFVILLRNGYPINVLDRIKTVQEVCALMLQRQTPFKSLSARRIKAGASREWWTIRLQRCGDRRGRSGPQHLLRNIIGYKR
jgi:hypothetical protein